MKSAGDALEAQGCNVVVHSSNNIPPEFKKKVMADVIDGLVDRIVEGMPTEVKNKLEKELLDRVEPENSTVN